MISMSVNAFNYIAHTYMVDDLISLYRQWVKTCTGLLIVMGIPWIIGVLQFHKALIVLGYIFAIIVALQVRTPYTKNTVLIILITNQQLLLISTTPLLYTGIFSLRHHCVTL